MHAKRLQDVTGVLVNNALGALAERLDRFIVPPLTQIPVLVILTTCDQCNSLSASEVTTL